MGVISRLAMTQYGMNVSSVLSTGRGRARANGAYRGSHFGLGGQGTYERIEVVWPGGSRQTFSGGAANRVVTLVEAR